MLPEAALHELFHWFEPLGALDPALRERLRESATPLHLERGQLAFDEGSPCGSFMLLTAGCLKVFRVGPRGREILLYRVEPGETCVLTLNCLLTGSSYPARAVAAAECHGVALPRPLFLQCLENEPRVRDLVLRSLSSRIVELMGLVEEVAFNRLDERVARWLVARADRMSSNAIQVTHQEIADELGSVREIVSRILGSLADRKIVSLERGQIRVLDSAALRAISQPE